MRLIAGNKCLILHWFINMKIIILALLLTGCAVTDFKQTFSPKTQVVTIESHTNSLWSNPQINGIDIGGTLGAEYHIKLQSATNDEVTGLQSFNAALPGIVGAAVKAAMEGAGIAATNPGSVGAALKSIAP